MRRRHHHIMDNGPIFRQQSKFFFFSTNQNKCCPPQKWSILTSRSLIPVKSERAVFYVVLISSPLPPLPPPSKIYLSDIIFWVEVSSPRANTDM